MKIFSSIVSFFQRQIVKAASAVLPRLLSNRWLDCLYTEIECKVHRVVDLDHLGKVWIAQTIKKYDDFLGSVEFRLDGQLWRLTRTHYDWYGVVYYTLRSPEGATRMYCSEESRTTDELKWLRNFSEFMGELDPDSNDMGLYTHKDILELQEILTAAREYVDDVYEPYWVTQLPDQLELGLHLTQNTKPPCPTCNAFHGPASLCVLLDNNF